MRQVAVIMPTRNRVKFVPTAVGSVLNQDFADLELVIIDDASDDRTPEVIRGFKDERIRWIRHGRSLGGSAARNAGIRSSRSEFVAFLDDDDEWYREKLARQISVMLRSAPAVGCVYTGYDMVDRTSGRICGRKVPSSRGDLSSALLRENCVGGTSSVLIRRKCLEDVGLFDESLPSFQDYDLWIRLSRVCRFDYLSEALLKYHLHSNKISTRPEAIQAGLEILLRKHGPSEPFRKYCSFHYLSLAVQFFETGNALQARKSLLRAISLYPSDIRPYYYFALSLVGRKNYQRIQKAKTRILQSPVGKALWSGSCTG